MEITFKKIRIRNYIRSLILKSEKNASRHYIHSFNPFYNWKIGILEGDSIRSEIIQYISNNTFSEGIQNNPATIKKLAIILELIKGEYGQLTKDGIPSLSWLSIRQKYHAESKKEYEYAIGTMEFIENIDYSKNRNGDLSNDSYQDTKKSKSTNSTVSDDAAEGENNGRELIEDDIIDLLDPTRNGDWTVKVISDREGYKFVVFNLQLRDEVQESTLRRILEKLQEYFTMDYSTRPFEVVHAHDRWFISGGFKQVNT